MGYGFGVPGKVSHRRALVELLHRMRWSDEMPETFEGLSVNLILETAVDQLDADGDEEYRAEAARRREDWSRTG